MIAYLRYSPRPRDKVDTDPLGDTLPKSFATQRSLIGQYLATRGMPPVAVWLEDPLVSARKVCLAERPGGGQLCRQIDAGCRQLIVASVDRLFRDVVDGLQMLEHWSELGVVLHSCDGFALDTSTAYGYFMSCQILTFASFEPRLTAERTKKAFASMRRAGKRTNSTPRFGYRFEGQCEVPDEHEQSICRRVRSLFAGGLGYRDIGRLLEQEGVRCRQKSRWHPQTIKRIVENGDAAR